MTNKVLYKRKSMMRSCNNRKKITYFCSSEDRIAVAFNVCYNIIVIYDLMIDFIATTAGLVPTRKLEKPKI